MPTLQEPDWESDLEDIQKAYNECSATLNTRFTPTLVTGILLRILQAHFYDPANIRDEKLKGLLWLDEPPSSDSAESKITIAPMYMYDTRVVERKPALLVARGPFRARKLPMQSKFTTGFDDNGNFSGDKYMVPVDGGHTVRCIAKTAFASDRLAEEVFYFLLETTPALLDDFPFGDLDVTTLGAPTRLDTDSGEVFAADVSVTWAHTHGWTMKAVAPILKKVRMDASAR